MLLKFSLIFSFALSIASYMNPIAGFSSESTKRRTLTKGAEALGMLQYLSTNYCP